MWKSLLAGTAVLALAGSGIGLAQQRPDTAPPAAQATPAPAQPGSSARTTDRSAVTDRQAFLDARIAGLRAGLALTPEQEKAWPAFERAYRDFAAERMAAREARRAAMRAGRMDAEDRMDRLQRMADQATRRAAALKQLADATAPLVKSLDDSQQRRFWALARPMGPHFAGRDGRGRPDWHHHGRDGRMGWHDRHHGRYGFHGPDRWRDGYGRDGYEHGRDRGDRGRERWGRGPGFDGPTWREGRRDDDRWGRGAYRSDDRRPLHDGEERL